MKLIIDIDKEKYNKFMYSDDIDVEELDEAFEYLTNGTPIPDNATNGDVIKAMFKPNRITRTDDIVHIDYDFTPEWWNAPYQKVGKE